MGGSPRCPELVSEERDLDTNPRKLPGLSLKLHAVPYGGKPILL